MRVMSAPSSSPAATSSSAREIAVVTCDLTLSPAPSIASLMRDAADSYSWFSIAALALESWSSYIETSSPISLAWMMTSWAWESWIENISWRARSAASYAPLTAFIAPSRSSLTTSPLLFSSMSRAPLESAAGTCPSVRSESTESAMSPILLMKAVLAASFAFRTCPRAVM